MLSEEALRVALGAVALEDSIVGVAHSDVYGLLCFVNCVHVSYII